MSEFTDSFTQPAISKYAASPGNSAYSCGQLVGEPLQCGKRTSVSFPSLDGLNFSIFVLRKPLLAERSPELVQPQILSGASAVFMVDASKNVFSFPVGFRPAKARFLKKVPHFHKYFYPNDQERMNELA